MQSIACLLSITLCYVVTLAISAPNTDVQVRPDYGVSFVRMDEDLFNGHSFVNVRVELIRIDSDPVPEPIRSSAKILKDSPMRRAARFLDAKVTELFENVKILQNELLDLAANLTVPNLAHVIHARVKRAPFEFFGYIERTLFGTATLHDLAHLRGQITQVFDSLKDSAELMRFLASDQELLADHIVKVTQVFEASENITSRNFKIIERRFNGLLRTIGHALTSISTNITRDVDHTRFVLMSTIQYTNYLRMQEYLQHALSTLGLLSHGILPVSALSRNDLSVILDRVNQNLTSMNSDFQTLADAAYIYEHSHVIPAFHNNSISAILKIPVVRNNSQFALYAVHKVAVPSYSSINIDDDNSSSMILDLPDYLAINRASGQFIELFRRDIILCNRRSSYQCNIPFGTFDFHHKTCAMALFLGDDKATSRLCDFQHLSQRPEDKAISLGNSQYFVITSQPQYDVFDHTVHTTCNVSNRMFVLTVPCMHRISIGDLTLHYDFVECKYSGLNVRVEQRFNIPLLSSFNNISFQGIKRLAKIGWNMTKLELNTHYQLKKFPSLKRDGERLKELSRKIRDDIDSLDTEMSMSDFEGITDIFDIAWLRYVIYACMILSLLLSGYTFYRHRKLQMHVTAMLISHFPKAYAADEDIHSLISKAQASESLMEQSKAWLDIINRDITLYAVLLIVIYIAIRIVFKICTRMHKSCGTNVIVNNYLALRFNRGWTSLLLPIMPVTLEVNASLIRAHGVFYQVIPNYRIFPSAFEIKWSDSLTIEQINGVNKPIHMIEHVTIPIADRFKFARLYWSSKTPVIDIVLIRGERISQILSAKDEINVPV